ncbi:NDP-hexose 2,3-dehydratase family protein [Maricaulaceae bacterium EIL42A08]|nr:NDP-hexose 2,3-dehydratase family protein [Maricaulaceae bacterium EIL42A08]
MISGIEELSRAVALERQGFSVAPVAFDEMAGWSIVSGALQHTTRGFFNVVGIRQAGSFDRVFLYQPQAAISGLITTLKDGERYYLLQARAEPGSPGGVQFGPTVQATAANYTGLHGGAATPYIEYFIHFDPRAKILSDTSQTDLGERYLYKTKRAIVIEIAEMDEPLPSFYWVRASTLVDAIGQSLFLNPDLRSLIALAPWGDYEMSDHLYPRAQAVRRSLTAGQRPEVLGRWLALRCSDVAPIEYIGLHDLKGWSIGAAKICESRPRQGISVGGYRTCVAEREVRQWSQPLIEAQGEGLAVLACRHGSEGLEVFTAFARETGFGQLAGLGPSYTCYPGTVANVPEWLREPQLKTIHQCEESDEGGRFFRNIWRFKFAMLETTPPKDVEEQGLWLRVSELKTLLATSNVCTIQLRMMASHLLALMPDE